MGLATYAGQLESTDPVEAPEEHTLKIMWPDKGDEHLTWDPKDKKSVRRARDRFNALVKPKNAGEGAQLFNAYSVEFEEEWIEIDEDDPTLTNDEKNAIAAAQRAGLANPARIKRVRRQGQQIEKFDKDAGEILLAPALQGG